jgi:cystathionine beta-lyase
MKTNTKILSALPVDELTGAISVPIYQTATFVQEAPGIHKGFDYARTNNPTRQVLENLIAELEEGSGGFAFSSGLAAIDAVLKLLKSGDEILAVDDIYGGSFRLFTHVYSKFGIKVNYVNTAILEEVKANINPATRFIWLETPTNPTLKISDIKAIADIAHANKALLVVDNTFASPVSQQPILLGADIVVHSATKYLAGHSDLIAGLVVCASTELSEKIKFIQNASGAILSPFDSFLTIRGITTLELRIRQQSENAKKVAEFLLSHPLVKSVNYPGLDTHLNHDIALKQQKYSGGVLSFSLHNDVENDAINFVSTTRLFKLAESLGGVKSLICHPANMTHKSVPLEKRTSAGINDSLIRLSCGIEDADDLIADLEQAFSYINKFNKSTIKLN